MRMHELNPHFADSHTTTKSCCAESETPLAKARPPSTTEVALVFGSYLRSLPVGVAWRMSRNQSWSPNLLLASLK